MLKKICRCFILIIIMAGFVYSFGLKDDITISLEEKQIQDLSTTGLNLVFYVNLTNSSSKTYLLSSYSYRFVVGQKEYFRLQTPLENRLAVGPSRNTLIALPVKITYELLLQSINEIESKDMVPCYLMGEMTFSEGRKRRGSLPFAFSGEFPILRSPAMSLADLKVNTLSIGGADLIFETKIINQNGFELQVERIRYDLKFGGHQIDQSRFQVNKDILSHQEKVVSIPLLLDFFEMGKDVMALLQQDSLECQFSGEIEINTKWGQVAIPFSVADEILILRSN